MSTDSTPAHWLTSAELVEALQYATGSIRLTAAIVTAREALDEIERLRGLLAEIRTRRAADPTSEDVEALAFARDLMAIEPFGLQSHDPDVIEHTQKCAASVAVLDGLIAGRARP